MQMRQTILFTIILASLATILFAKDKPKQCKKKEITGFVISASELNKVLVLNEKGEITREINAHNTYDAFKLKNGNILYAAYHAVQLISPKNEILLNFESESEIFACQPLKGNKFLIGDCSKGRLLEVNLDGEITKKVSLTFKTGGHSCFRGARKTKNGHYLVSHYADKTVREYNAKGTVIQEIKRPYNVYAAQRISKGRTLISDKHCLSIYDKKGTMIWEFDTRDYPELGVNHLTGFQYLSNDEIVVCNWLGHKPFKKGIPVFRINLKKEILWKYQNASQTYSCTNIQVLQ